MSDTSISRALISVSDKTHLITLASYLREHHIEIISTGGTAKTLKEQGIPVTDISDYTGAPEMLDGRVKTLHPKIHGGLLGCLDNPSHLAAMKDHDISPISLVIVNLYPFEATVARGAGREEIIENIDIGGPSMIRSAAKNHHFTTVITHPDDYALLIEEMTTHKGKTSLAFRQQMAAKAFACTARYDSAIDAWFTKSATPSTDFPAQLAWKGTLKQTLRYGENPHQKAAFYTTDAQCGIGAAQQLQGKELSYNNIHDADAALQLVSEFKKPTAVIVKHTNPCGVSESQTIEQAYDQALKADPVSAFGGILAFNCPITLALAEKISPLFAEAIIAPAIVPSAQELLSKKKNLRVLIGATMASGTSLSLKSVIGGVLVQETDSGTLQPQQFQCVTQHQPSKEELADLLFAFTVCKHVKSNAIVVAKDSTTLGIGAGQTSRVDATALAIQKALSGQSRLAPGTVLASDAFFPFPDSIEQAANAGITAIISPAGSIRDAEVIEAANKARIALVHTTMRHFRH